MTTAIRRLGLAIERACRDHGRPVVLLMGLRPGAGVTTLTASLRRTLAAEGRSVRVLEGAVLSTTPALPADDALVILDGGAVLAGRGPVIDPGWRPLISGVVVVVCAERDVAADADEAAALLAALELPVMGVVWSERAAPPPGDLLSSLRRRAAGLKGSLVEGLHRLHRLVAPGGAR